MKKLQTRSLANILILLSLLLFSKKIEARSPAVLPVRGLEIPDAHKKYPNGPPDINKTSFFFNKGIPKVLTNQGQVSTYQQLQISPSSTIALVIFAGTFALIAPLIYFLFFRRRQTKKIGTIELERHLKIATLPPEEKRTAALTEEKNQTEKIKKAS